MSKAKVVGFSDGSRGVSVFRSRDINDGTSKRIYRASKSSRRRVRRINKNYFKPITK